MPSDATQTYLALGKAMDWYWQTINEAQDIELDAKKKRAAADVAKSDAYLRAEGMTASDTTTRRHKAEIDPVYQRLNLEADQAEVAVTLIKRRIEWCKERVMTLMAEGSYQKSVARTTGFTPDTWT